VAIPRSALASWRRPPTKGAADQVVEWIKPGLHIKYLPSTDLPYVPGPAPTYECVPGTDCNGSDVMKANSWSALPNAVATVADLNAVKAASRPNLVFEVQTRREADA